MVFQLEVLGGLRLVAPDGQVAQVQRRRLALLALLAAAGERGLTRDQLVGCLWPETTQENAKHALNQSLYSIRRTLGEGAVQGVDPLWLDPAIVDSDVRRFERALAAGEHADAVAHYRGPFLNGFYLASAPEFERSVERERARLAAAHVDAVERLATCAERGGDAAASVTWRRMLVELEPLDARRATSLMRAFAAAGDSAAAIAHGRMYETLVRHELDAPADPAVLALASDIRTASRQQPSTSAVATALAPPLAPPLAVPLVPTTAATRPATLAAPTAPAIVGAPRRRPRRVMTYAVAALALAVAVFGARRLAREGPGAVAVDAAPAPSIAVLPLRNLSADQADAALADGMTEELIAMLARMGDVRVIASTSVYALEDRHMDVRQIAESLHVSHVLEGGLQKAGGRLRLQLRLIDARDGATRWSESYDREMGDVFAMQDDIARAVSRELGIRLARGDRARAGAPRYTPGIEAYEWYLRGMDPTLTRSADGFRQARAHLLRAIATDSSFAAAYAALALVYIRGAGGETPDQREVRALATQAALKAVALDDSLADAHVALGWTHISQSDWTAAETELKRALALDWRAHGAHEGLGRVYLWTGHPAEQLAVARTGVELDPFSVTAIRELALALAMNGRCDDAVERLRPLKALTPPVGLAGVITGQCYAAANRWPEAIAEFRWATETKSAGMALAFLAYAQARAGQRDEAQRVLADLLAGRRHSNGAFGIATIYSGLGDYDAAFTWLEKALDEQSVRPYVMGPMFEELRRDARFAHVRQRLGI